MTTLMRAPRDRSPSQSPARSLALVVLALSLLSCRNAARETEILNAKQIMLAVQMADTAMNAFPAGIVDADGKPLLSWRVAILPGLSEEGKKLLEEFHLDEPWDSDHNKTLIPRMPAVFAAFGVPPQQGLTGVVVAAGPGMAFGETDGTVNISSDGRSAVAVVKAGSFRDGMANTAFIVVIPGLEVPWTKPTDFLDDPVELFAKLRKQGARSAVVTTADGAVFQISTAAKPDALRAFFSKAGNEFFSDDDLE